MLARRRFVKTKLEGAGMDQAFWDETPVEEWEYESPLNAYLSICGTAGGLASSAAQGRALLATTDPDQTFTDAQCRSAWGRFHGKANGKALAIHSMACSNLVEELAAGQYDGAEKQAAEAQVVTLSTKLIKGGRKGSPFSFAKVEPANGEVTWWYCEGQGGDYKLAAGHLISKGETASIDHICAMISGRPKQHGGKNARETAVAAEPGSSAATRLICNGRWMVEHTIRLDATLLERTYEATAAADSSKVKQRHRNNLKRKREQD